MKYYLMSDIHGRFDKFEKALEKWNTDDTLLVMGDLIDRGPQSLEVVRKCMELKKEYGDKVVILKGNHEEMFCDWFFKIPQEIYSLYYSSTHSETLRSFIGDKKFKKLSRQNRAMEIVRNFKPELNFLNSLDEFYEAPGFIAVHAGLDLNLNDWRDSPSSVLLWEREDFYNSDKAPEKRVFFGHTPTYYLKEKSSFNFSPWFSPDGMKVGIDGAASMSFEEDGHEYRGQLNTLLVSENGEILNTLSF